MEETMVLPKTYSDKAGKYPEHEGKPKGSYSQYTSYADEQYRNDYYVEYFFGFKLPGGDFAEFGGQVGKYIETKAAGNPVQGPNLSRNDVLLLDKLDYPGGCVYEDHIVVDLGSFVMEGYIDRTRYDGMKVEILDYKTGNLEKKKEFYASEEYGQTTLYCYQKQKEGWEIAYSGVKLLGRKGSSLDGENNYRLRLEGLHVDIPTPYSKEKAEKLLDKIRATFSDISQEYQTYLKLFR